MLICFGRRINGEDLGLDNIVTFKISMEFRFSQTFIQIMATDFYGISQTFIQIMDFAFLKLSYKYRICFSNFHTVMVHFRKKTFILKICITREFLKMENFHTL